MQKAPPVFLWSVALCLLATALMPPVATAGSTCSGGSGLGGVGGDALDAEVQSNLFSCGGTFAAPPDGDAPRLVISTCALGGPERDGALDNSVITYLYWLGVTQRLTGGPGNVSCQSNAETAIVGW